MTTSHSKSRYRKQYARMLGRRALDLQILQVRIELVGAAAAAASVQLAHEALERAETLLRQMAEAH